MAYNILWTDESKVIIKGFPGIRQFVRRPRKSEFNPRYTVKAVKHGGGNIKIWGSFSYYGTGP